MSKVGTGGPELDGCHGHDHDPSAANGETARTLESDATTVAASAPAAVPEAGVPPVPDIDAVVETQYPGPLKFWLVVFCLCTILFLVVLDSTVISPAAPAITDEFHSLRDLGWYSSAYYMTLCIAQLQFGKLNVRYPIRRNYSAAMLLFLVGSAVCGAAPSSGAFIAGRALAGLGCSGLLISTFSLVPVLAPPIKRPIFTDVIGGTLGLGMSIGPLVGGAMTQNVTWRWNFYMNLPIGAACLAVFFFFVHPPKLAPPPPLTPWGLFQSLDMFGLFILTPCIICLLIALQWGGTVYGWDNGRIIALLVMFGVLGIAFGIIEVLQGMNAMIPRRVVTQRSLISAVLFCFTNAGSTYPLLYYLPVWFQAVKGSTALQSGVYMLPLVVSQTISSIGGGVGVSLLGYIWPFMISASVLTAIPAGLFQTFTAHISTGKWVGYQILYGFGQGFGSQTPLMVAQNVLRLEDIPIGSGLIMFAQTVAGAVFNSVVQALFANRLEQGLRKLTIPNLDVQKALAGGVTQITEGLQGNDREQVVSVINDAMVHAWLVCAVLASVSLLGALGIERRRIQGHEAPKATDSANEEGTAEEKPRGQPDATADRGLHANKQN